MEEEIKRLKQELEKIRFQFYLFYELTKVMRSTLRLEEIVYIILTGLTTHQGLAFNRAILFLADEKNKKINGFMGIGPIDGQEADLIWRNIEKEKRDLYDLVKAYHHLKEKEIKPKFMEFIQSLSFSLSQESGFIFNALFEKGSLHIKEDKVNRFKNDPLINQLQLKEFLVSSLWIKGKPQSLILVDNYITKKPITNEDVKIFNMFVEYAQGAIENSQEFENTLIKAHTDPLTSLWNHGYFQYQLDEELLKAKSKNSCLSLMMIDLDDFKKFNDAFGHLRGDEILKKISTILQKNSREQDYLCRYGGEEFSLILPFTNKEEAFWIGEKIKKSVEENIIDKNKFTISIGIASFPQDALDKNSLIKKTDEALYKAKSRGKNQVVLA